MDFQLLLGKIESYFEMRWSLRKRSRKLFKHIRFCFSSKILNPSGNMAGQQIISFISKVNDIPFAEGSVK